MLVFESLDQHIQDELCITFDLQIGKMRPGSKLQQIYFHSERSEPKNFKRIEGMETEHNYCISSTEDNHKRVRHLIVEFMKNNPNNEWREFWQRKESCADMEIAAKNSSDVARYGSTVHIIAAAKLLDVNILTYNEAIGWTLYTPDIETGPSPELLQDAEKPTISLYYNGSHFDVILDMGSKGKGCVGAFSEKALNPKTLETEKKEPASLLKPKPSAKKLSGATNASTRWAREWDTGKDPVDKWKMNVPDLGDTTSQGSSYFRSSFHPRGLARTRGGNDLPKGFRQPKPVRNPGFFHDDRFDHIPENFTKIDGETNTKNQLPAAVRDKKIASRLSIVDRQPTSTGSNVKQDSKSVQSPDNSIGRIKNANFLHEKLPVKQQRSARPTKDKPAVNPPHFLPIKLEKDKETKNVKETNKAVRPAYAPAHWNRRRNENGTGGHYTVNQSDIKRLLQELVDKVSMDMIDLEFTEKNQTPTNRNCPMKKCLA
uniref:Ubiquitinyl hydrolase 1 n=1 Tax=Ditylenchus dipsaci TaxID=166011 RepID=A0A915D3C8_9BILA